MFRSIDYGGRYANRNQPGSAHWNLACFAQTLLPLLAEHEEQALTIAQETIDQFPSRFESTQQRGMGCKLGLLLRGPEDEALVDELLELMAAHGTEFTLTFRTLADLADPTETEAKTVGEIFPLRGPFDPWLSRWRERFNSEPGSPSERHARMTRSNPVYIPRNHLVANAIEAAENEGNFSPFHALVGRLAKPFDYDPAQREFALPPRPEQVVRQTFCGT